ncbi:unnamed protein product [marine sediment metagenome]|uniref:Uncharacterized protein n=1 Tax=marine sediment metagenome TaxID=412755 RepID=X0Y2J7_9ZZZZ
MFMEYGFSNYQVLKMATFGNAQILKLDDYIGNIPVEVQMVVRILS